MSPSRFDRPPTIPIVDERRPDLGSAPAPRLLWEFDAKTCPLRGVAIHGLERVAAVGGHDGRVMVVDMNDGGVLARHRTEGFVWECAFSDWGERLTAIGVQGEMFAWEWFEDFGPLVGGVHPGLAAQNSRPTLAPHGDAVAVQHVDGIAVWDVEAVGRRSKTAPLGAIATDMAFDPEARFLAFVPNRREGPPARIYHHVNGALAVLPPRERLRSPVAPGSGPSIRLFDTTDGSPVTLHDDLAAYGGSSVQLAKDRVLVVCRSGRVESFAWPDGTRVGPSITGVGGSSCLHVSGPLALTVGRGWCALDWRDGTVLAAVPLPDRRSRPRPFQGRIDHETGIAVITYDDGVARAFQVTDRDPG